MTLVTANPSPRDLYWRPEVGRGVSTSPTIPAGRARPGGQGRDRDASDRYGRLRPVSLGLAASLARPGGNVTGLSLANVLNAAKNLELLRDVAPAIRRVVALWYEPNESGRALLGELQQASPRLGIDLRPVGVRGPDGFEAAFRAATEEHAHALFIVNAGRNSQPARILEFVDGARLPAMFVRREYVEGGGLMSYGVDFAEVYRRAASYVDKILKGANPADLPVEQPAKFDFVINLKAAQTIGLTIPQAVLQQATELVQ